MLQPASTIKVCPVIARDELVSRNLQTVATSRGGIMPSNSGCLRRITSDISGSVDARLLIAVCVSAGAIAFTRIFDPAYEAAMLRLIARVAPLLAAYATVSKYRNSGWRARMLLMFRITPR